MCLALLKTGDFFCCRGLAKCINDTPINAKTGAEAKSWKSGKPVRVVRNCKLSKHSKYAPVEGNRYDGIYKVCMTLLNESLVLGLGVYIVSNISKFGILPWSSCLEVFPSVVLRKHRIGVWIGSNAATNPSVKAYEKVKN